jgi:hypothetical protein
VKVRISFSRSALPALWLNRARQSLQNDRATELNGDIATERPSFGYFNNWLHTPGIHLASLCQAESSSVKLSDSASYETHTPKSYCTPSYTRSSTQKSRKPRCLIFRDRHLAWTPTRGRYTQRFSRKHRPKMTLPQLHRQSYNPEDSRHRARQSSTVLSVKLCEAL